MEHFQISGGGDFPSIPGAEPIQVFYFRWFVPSLACSISPLASAHLTVSLIRKSVELEDGFGDEREAVPRDLVSSSRKLLHQKWQKKSIYKTWVVPSRTGARVRGPKRATSIARAGQRATEREKRFGRSRSNQRNWRPGVGWRPAIGGPLHSLPRPLLSERPSFARAGRPAEDPSSAEKEKSTPLP